MTDLVAPIFAICPECEQTKKVAKGGVIAAHDAQNGKPCPGSGMQAPQQPAQHT